MPYPKRKNKEPTSTVTTSDPLNRPIHYTRPTKRKPLPRNSKKLSRMYREYELENKFLPHQEDMHRVVNWWSPRGKLEVNEAEGSFIQKDVRHPKPTGQRKD
ncbi:hypothetical protein RCL1_001956 [Eukaryota sp. TZLM3-RCL]